MSRFACIKTDNGNQVAYGLDGALGWFYQEFDENDGCVVDKDTMFDGLGNGELVYRLRQTTANPGHITAIAMDRDPAEYKAVMEGC